MVNGLDVFKEKFSPFTNSYVLIGGTASTLAMEELGEEFRATKDLDIVLIIEALEPEFVSTFWDFIKAGEYENRQKSTGKRLFYRFYKPANPQYPEMIELFSRKPDSIDLEIDSGLTPIPMDEEISSLSAILMDDDYYSFVRTHRQESGGLSFLGPESLIPLKGRAYTDLTNRKEAGEKIDSKNIRKHKNDIFRLFTILDPEKEVELPESLKEHLRDCFKCLEDESVDVKALGIRSKSKAEIIDELRRFYGL